MTFKEYQEKAMKTAIYPGKGGGNFVYPTLGLVGEAGEIANKVKKVQRDDNGILSGKKREDIAFELGDVLWYCAALADELGFSLDDLAQNNIYKLQKRQEEGKLQGSGDAR